MHQSIGFHVTWSTLLFLVFMTFAYKEDKMVLKSFSRNSDILWMWDIEKKVFLWTPAAFSLTFSGVLVLYSSHFQRIVVFFVLLSHSAVICESFKHLAHTLAGIKQYFLLQQGDSERPVSWKRGIALHGVRRVLKNVRKPDKWGINKDVAALMSLRIKEKIPSWA